MTLVETLHIEAASVRDERVEAVMPVISASCRRLIFLALLQFCSTLPISRSSTLLSHNPPAPPVPASRPAGGSPQLLS